MKIIKSQKGQALLFVVVAVTIALSIGVAISTRTLFMSSRTSRTDTSSRVFSVAEGGVERILTQNNAFLSSLSNKTQNCTQIGAESSPVQGECLIKFTSQGQIPAQARVSATTFSTNGENNSYWFNVNPGEVKEVRLEGYSSSSIKVCWDNKNSALYYIAYSADASDNVDMRKGGYMASDAPSNIKDNVSAFEVANSSVETGYHACDDISLSGMNGSLMGIRFKVLYDSSKVAVFSSSLPTQGYKITSIGELVNEGQVQTSKTITVYKSYPYLPSFMDYAIYSEGSL